MKIADGQAFQRDYPEEYPWHLVDSITASEIGVKLSGRVRMYLRRPGGDRVQVPGLRMALTVLAEYADE